MTKFLKSCAAAGFLLAAGSTQALSADATFSGTVVASCVLTVGTPGIMTANSSNTILSSKQAGGSVSTVVAAATGPSFSVSATAPGSFTLAPAGGDDNVTFAADYSLSGASSGSDIPAGTSTTLGTGVTTVAVNLAATKSTGIFTTGAYTAAVLITCE